MTTATQVKTWHVTVKELHERGRFWEYQALESKDHYEALQTAIRSAFPSQRPTRFRHDSGIPVRFVDGAWRHYGAAIRLQNDGDCPISGKLRVDVREIGA